MAQIYDTLLGEYIQNPGARWLGLDKLAIRDFNYQMIGYDELTDKWRISFKEIPLEIAGKYSGEDVYMTHKLYIAQKEKNIHKNSVLNTIEFPLIQVLQNIEITGVHINRDILKWIGLQLEQEINRLEKDIHGIAWQEFNISSPKQVWEILFDKMQLPKWKKTKTGYSVWAEVLWELAKTLSHSINDRRLPTLLKTPLYIYYRASRHSKG